MAGVTLEEYEQALDNYHDKRAAADKAFFEALERAYTQSQTIAAERAVAKARMAVQREADESLEATKQLDRVRARLDEEGYQVRVNNTLLDKFTSSTRTLDAPGTLPIGQGNE